MTHAPDEPSSPADSAELARSLIDTFGQGWAHQEAERLLSVFAEDAVFKEGPFAKPLVGIEAIRGYWADISYHQAEGRFSSGEIHRAGPWFAVEFRTVFRRRRTGEWVDVRGALFCETAAGSISEMRMYWHRWTRGREVDNSP